MELLKEESKKLEPKASKCVLIGYTNNGYVCYEIGTGKVKYSRNVTFDEEVFPFKSKVIRNSGSDSESENETEQYSEGGLESESNFETPEGSDAGNFSDVEDIAVSSEEDHIRTEGENRR